MDKTDDKILLEVTDLKQHFPFGGGFLQGPRRFVRAVDGISFRLHEGETLGLVGESGCGKSTTARTIAQIYQPTSGNITLEGRDMASLSKKELMVARKDVQMVFQDPYASLNPRMTVFEIIAEPLEIFAQRKIQPRTRAEIEARVLTLMDHVGLSRAFRNRFPHEFSGGQRQRIGIARALALQPKLILADEPVSALDVSIQAQILNLLKDLQEEFHLTYLFIAHDLAVIQYISDRIAVMYLGRIVELTTAENLYRQPLHPYTQALLSAAPIPDPQVERQRRRIILTGDVPSPTVEHTGCYFYERCSQRMARCAATVPPLKTVRPEHEVACFLYES